MWGVTQEHLGRLIEEWRMVRTAQGKEGEAGCWGVTYGQTSRVCHPEYGVPEEVWLVTMWQVLVMDATRGSLSWGACSQRVTEKGSTHISQVGHPWGVPSSGGRWCSSAGPGPWGRAW